MTLFTDPISAIKGLEPDIRSLYLNHLSAGTEVIGYDAVYLPSKVREPFPVAGFPTGGDIAPWRDLLSNEPCSIWHRANLGYSVG